MVSSTNFHYYQSYNNHRNPYYYYCDTSYQNPLEVTSPNTQSLDYDDEQTLMSDDEEELTQITQLFTFPCLILDVVESAIYF